MTSESIKERLTELVNAYFEGTEFFLVDISLSVGDKIQIYADHKERNIQIDDCVSLSRHLESYIEEEGLAGEKYNLEVSSPGMGNPLKVKAQYVKSIGRMMQIWTNDNRHFKGILKAVNADGIEVDVVVGKHKKQLKYEAASLKFEEILKIKKEITFK